MESNATSTTITAPTAPKVKPAGRRRWLRGTRLWVSILVIVALVLAGVVAKATIFPSTPKTQASRLVTATLGDVKASVTGTGSLTPVSQLNLNFRTSGQITELDVKVGDSVKAGQVLAKIDSTTQQATLATAQASLLSANAALQAAQSPLTSAQLAQLQHALQAAQTNYNDTVTSVNATNSADAQQLATDQGTQTTAQSNYNANNCAAPSPPPACSGPAGYGAALDSANAKVAQDQSKQSTDQVAGQARINQASGQVTAAQDNLNVQSQVKPNAVAQAQAQVASAAAQVQSAQMALDQTTLTAPTDGTVTGVTGAVGETAGSGGSGTAQAPGSSGPLSSGSSSSSSGSNGSSSSSGASSSATVVLASANGFQAVIPFPESDAAKLSPNQDVNLTFDAVPNLNVNGKVLAVSPTASVVSNVVNYYATIVLNSADSRLKSGMTTNASVTVKEVSNVLSLPNTAVQSSNGTATVNLVRNGQQTSVEVVTGLVGDNSTEIKAGINDGDQVALPQTRSTTNQNQGGGPRIGGGGGFGGGF